MENAHPQVPIKNLSGKNLDINRTSLNNVMALLFFLEMSLNTKM